MNINSIDRILREAIKDKAVAARLGIKQDVAKEMLSKMMWDKPQK